MLSHVILLGQVKKLSNLVGALGAKATRLRAISDIRDILVSLLDDDKVEDRDIGTDNAATDGLALALAGTAGTVAREALGQKQTGSAAGQNTLLHGESLLVVSTGDTEDIAGEILAKILTGDLLRDALIEEATTVNIDNNSRLDICFADEQACMHGVYVFTVYILVDSIYYGWFNLQSLLIVDLDELLQASCGVCDIEL
jgi:hypothetical protein